MDSQAFFDGIPCPWRLCRLQDLLVARNVISRFWTNHHRSQVAILARPASTNPSSSRRKCSPNSNPDTILNQDGLPSPTDKRVIVMAKPEVDSLSRVVVKTLLPGHEHLQLNLQQEYRRIPNPTSHRVI